MAKRRRRKYGKRAKGEKHSYKPDLFMPLTIHVPKTMLPLLMDRAFKAGMDVPTVCAHALYGLIAFPWGLDLTIPENVHGEVESRQKVFSMVAAAPKGISLADLVMLEAYLGLGREWILIAVGELILTGDIEFFEIPNQQAKGVRISNRHTLVRRSFKRFAGESQKE